MTLFLSKIVGSVVQFIGFAIIPFIWWLVSGREEDNFFRWVGIKKSEEDNKKTILMVIALSAVFMLLGAGTLYVLRGTETATSEFTGAGVSAVPAILVYAVFNTALPEELFFRGFLLKVISGKFGFFAGNIIQAALFALFHGLMFISFIGVAKTIIVILFTGVIACSMGYINEKSANGSIIPSWVIHSAANVFSGICAAFLLI